MPGIIGCFKSVGSKEELIQGRDLLCNKVELIEEPLYEKDQIFCSRVHLGIIGVGMPHGNNKNESCWLEGEFYNIDYLRKTFRIEAQNESEIILESYRKGILNKVLGKLDGYFCCLIHDQSSETLTFITDRFGMKPLYLWKKGDRILAWSSEVKGFFPFINFEKKVAKENALDFLASGNYLENTTLFENVSLIEPSTILTIDCKNERVAVLEKYWEWSTIKTLDISFEVAVMKFGALLNEAIHSRMKDIDNLCISLSGGLDSRVILAVAKTVKPDIKTFTFGIRGSYEQGIAAKVAKAAKVKNYLFPLNNDNWLNNRVEGIWKTDGMLNFIHMHGSVYHKDFRKVNAICLHGIGGGILLGGRMLQENSVSAVEKQYGKRSGKIDRANPFFQLQDKECQYLINNHLRRFTQQGIIEQKNMEYRMPFFHNDLIEFLFAIPNAYRKNAILFNKTLLKKFPDLFDKIPYSNISYPISGKKRFNSKVKRKIHYLSYKYKLSSAYHITNYPIWVKNIEPLITRLLHSNKAIYKEYIKEEDFKIPDFKDYLATGRMLTFEIYLQQLFNNRYFTTNEFLACAQ